MSTEHKDVVGVKAILNHGTFSTNFVVLHSEGKPPLVLWPEDPSRIIIGEQPIDKKEFTGTLLADVIGETPGSLLVKVVSRGLEHVLWVDKGTGEFKELVEKRIPRLSPKK